MKPFLNTLALLAAAGLGAVVLGSAPAASQEAPQTTRIAFVDLSKALRGYDKAKTIRGLVDDGTRKVEELLKEPYEKLRRKQADLELLERGTEKFREEKRLFDLEVYQLDYRKNQMLQALQRSKVEKMILVYTEIRNQAEVYCRKNGYGAALMVNASEIEARSDEEVMGQIALRQVLYWDKSLDITDEILKILNESMKDEDD